MFFVTYLRRELRRRLRQAIVIALGLATGIGLVVTVSAASAGVTKAQSSVLATLYGVGTDVTVTGAAPRPRQPDSTPPPGALQIQLGPNGPEECSGGKCTSLAGKTIENVNSPYAAISASRVSGVAGLHGVAADAGGLTLLDQSMTFAKSGSALPQTSSVSIDGVDVGHSSLGPLSAAELTSGHAFSAADADSDVAIVDSAYATSNNLRVGSSVTLDHVAYTVIGIARQPQSSNPPQVYIPLARAQAITARNDGSLAGKVNTIYVSVTSSSDVSAVATEISTLLPGTTVTTESNLASTVTGSLSSAATLANDLGLWMSVLVLIAAFAVASLLTMAAVSHRAREFGVLKAIGWRSRRIVAQVLGEAVVLGAVGGIAGVGLGFAGAAIIGVIAPKLSAIVGGSTGPQVNAPAGAHLIGGANLTHTVAVPLDPSVTAGVVVLAVVLAVLGGLLAGSVGSWRISRLRPSAALRRVE